VNRIPAPLMRGMKSSWVSRKPDRWFKAKLLLVPLALIVPVLKQPAL
jgi:hypothetical protein